jgi:ribonuclease HII
MWRNELRLRRRAGWRGLVAGVDEAGRGPLAGPVFAAAAVLPRRAYLPGLDDSKRVRASAREGLCEMIKHAALAWFVAELTTDQVDSLNILRASHEAMRRALAGVLAALDLDGALVDGLPVAALGPRHVAVVDGDALCPSIAAASVLAKVHRDRRMCELDLAYPQYGFAKHKGYATPEHLAALRQHGPCPLHRRSFHWQGRSLFELKGHDRHS